MECGNEYGVHTFVLNHSEIRLCYYHLSEMMERASTYYDGDDGEDDDFDSIYLDDDELDDYLDDLDDEDEYENT